MIIIKENIEKLVDVLKIVDQAYEENNFDVALLDTEKLHIPLHKIYLLLEMALDSNLITGLSLSKPASWKI